MTNAISNSRRSSTCRLGKCLPSNLAPAKAARSLQYAALVCFAGDGIAVNSPLIEGLPTAAAQSRMIAWLEQNGHGRRDVRYKLRDWLFSRQRYWGEPFPIVWRDGKHEALPESELPLTPPELEDFKPTGTGEPPLARAKEWLRYSDAALRETNTMPQWAGSCWYYLRFCDPRNDDRFVGEGSGTLLDGRRDNRAASISTSAAPSTRCCICCMRASGTRCSSISDIFQSPSHSSAW